MSTESTDWLKAYAQAKAYDSKLVATDPRFKKSVLVVMRDGSMFKWRDAFYLVEKVPTIPIMRKGDMNVYLMVFTEHYGVHVFDDDDVLYKTDSDRTIATSSLLAMAALPNKVTKHLRGRDLSFLK